MYIGEGLFQMVLYLAIMAVITFVVLLKVKTSGIKVMVLGTGLILFTDSVLKQAVGRWTLRYYF